MISKTFANKILNSMLGKTSSSDTMPTMGKIYMGLCAREPNKETGSLAEAGEPAFNQGYSYARVQVAGGATPSFGMAGTNENGQSVNTLFGSITNDEEIKFNAAKDSYPEKINYWFLSQSDGDPDNNDNYDTNKKTAYVWGSIKDVLNEKQDVSGFTHNPDATAIVGVDGVNIYSAIANCKNSSLRLYEGQSYIVNWNGEDYKDLVAVRHEMGNVVYFVLGNPAVYGGDYDENCPFAVMWFEAKEGDYNVSKFMLCTTELNSTNTVGVYSLGINIAAATVPTFYSRELTISIDAK